MNFSMYDASVPVFVRQLTNMSAILDKAIAFAEARKIDETVLTGARLAPDMFPLTRQIQIASDAAKGAVARLGGLDVPGFEDTETTFADLKARLDKTVAFANSATIAQIDGSEDKKIDLKVGGRELSFDGKTYLLNFALPNFYFHLSMTYAILRHNGVDIGKMDFLGAVGA